MNKGRLEAFSDGVLAIILTIMVLEIKVPQGSDFEAIKPMFPVLSSYVLSFIYVGIYWNNHHHLMHTVKYVSGNILWANLHLLFWLSLVPLVTNWMGKNPSAPLPMALYGFMLLMASIAFWILQQQILKKHGKDSILAQALGNNFKGKLSPILYLIAIISTCYSEWISITLYTLVAFIWLIPDKRIEIIFDEKLKEVN
ncbi:MAG: TMEM175 family protein [Flectobacillus sp.]|nr:TMEM175 family protein [Flectobacillus sp.]